MDKSLLQIFSISWETATKNETFLPEFVSGKIKFEWDSVEKKYTDTPKSVVITAFFYALKRSKIDVLLPATAISEKTLEDLNKKAEEDADITLVFENFKISLKAGFNGDVLLVCTADGVTVN